MIEAILWLTVGVLVGYVVGVKHVQWERRRQPQFYVGQEVRRILGHGSYRGMVLQVAPGRVRVMDTDGDIGWRRAEDVIPLDEIEEARRHGAAVREMLTNGGG